MSGKRMSDEPQLIDNFGRIHSYLRLSITDNCNFRCSYCMPEGKACHNTSHSLSPSEIFDICQSFSGLGINKIRLTGGEPLLHANFAEIIEKLSLLPVRLALTTNGYLLHRHFETLKSNHVKLINISLDTLNQERFRTIAGTVGFEQVWENINLSVKQGFTTKINVVVIKGVNDDEILDFAALTTHLPLSVRFIEFMPFKENSWNYSRLFPAPEILNTIKKKYPLVAEENTSEGPSVNYKIPGSAGNIGIIGTVSQPFCESCNRVRITADGKIKSCLFGHRELDLLNALQNNEDLENYILESLRSKPKIHGGIKPFDKNAGHGHPYRAMHKVGG